MDLSGHEGHEIPIPIPITSTYVGGGAHNQSQTHHTHSHSHSSIIHDNQPTDPVLQPPSNGPLPLSAATSDDHHHLHPIPFNNKKPKVVVKYKECLKNHAAAIGGNATDGCGEFMPSGEDGTLEALKCSACGCHRNFHRKEIEGESSSSCDCHQQHPHHHHLKGRRVAGGGQKGLLISSSDPYGYNNPGGNSFVPRPSAHHMIMPLGALQTSESDEMDGGGGDMMARPVMAKKRFRTKFTPEQKEKMLGFAEKVGWRLQKQEENVVQQFCQEIGVKRRVLKVWMHNNKHNLAKKTSSLQLE